MSHIIGICLLTIQQLREEGFQAFYVAVGLQKALKLNIEGEELEGVVAGLDLLRGVNKGSITALEGDTVVIGGGNAAIDVARTALRLGKGSVNIYCLEKDEEMPTVNAACWCVATSTTRPSHTPIACFPGISSAVSGKAGLA